MSKYLILTKALIKNNFNPISNKKSKVKSILFIALIILALLPLAISFSNIASKLYDVLVTINQEGLIIGFGLSIVSMVIFFFGIFYAFNIFYFSKDIDNLLPLPLKPNEILSAKLSVALFYEYLTEIIFLLPFIITYGIKSSAGFTYYIYGSIVFITLPVIPLILASIISMVIMRFTNIAKNKDRFRMVGGIIAIFIAVSFNTYIQKYTNMNLDQNKLQEMIIQGNNSLLDISAKYFPSIKLGAAGMVNYYNLIGFYNILYFIAINLSFIIIFLLLGQLLYLKGVIGISETSKGKVFTINDLSSNISTRSPIWSYTIKELKILFRTPSYFMNCILMNFLWPVFILLPIILEPNIPDKLNKLNVFINNIQTGGIVIAGVFAASLFLTSTNSITSTAVSREGQNFYFSKYIPLNYISQIVSKVLSGIIMGAIGTLMLFIVALYFFKPSLLLIALSMIVSVFGILFSAFVGIIIDLLSPKLIWDNEQKAVKQNFNVLFTMILCALVAGATILGVVKFQLNIWATFIGIIIIFGAVNALIYKTLAAKGSVLFGRIEI